MIELTLFLKSSYIRNDCITTTWLRLKDHKSFHFILCNVKDGGKCKKQKKPQCNIYPLEWNPCYHFNHWTQEHFKQYFRKWTMYFYYEVILCRAFAFPVSEYVLRMKCYCEKDVKRYKHGNQVHYVFMLEFLNILQYSNNLMSLSF